MSLGGFLFGAFMLRRLVEGGRRFGFCAAGGAHAAVAVSFLEAGVHETGSAIHGGAVALEPKGCFGSFG